MNDYPTISQAYSSYQVPKYYQVPVLNCARKYESVFQKPKTPTLPAKPKSVPGITKHTIPEAHKTVSQVPKRVGGHMGVAPPAYNVNDKMKMKHAKHILSHHK